MSTKASDIFPDLHHKMSKKIAQLTKVIYHLNTKNEDHQSELENMSSNHQVEIQQILKDAAIRIAKFKDIIDTKQAQVNQEIEIDKLKQKHATEKANALKELEGYKAKVSDRESKIIKEYQSKLELVKEEISKINGRFSEKVTEFERINNELKSTGSKGLDDTKKRHDDEIADIIRSNNNKYQQMLLEQMKAQEEIRSECNKQLQVQKDSIEKELRRQFDIDIGQVRAQLNGDKQEALTAMRCDYEAKLQFQREDMTIKLEKLLSDIKQRNEENDTLKTDKNRLIDEIERLSKDFNSKLSELNSHMSDKVANQDGKYAAISLELQQVNNKLATALEQVHEKEASIDTLQRMLTEKNTIITSLEEALNRSIAEVSKLTNELHSAHKNGASAESQLQNQLTIAEKESASLRGEINQMGTTIANLREEVKKMEKSYHKLVHDNDKNVSKLTGDIAALSKQLHDALQSSTTTAEMGNAELTKLRKLLEEKNIEYKKQLVSIDDSRKKDIASITERHMLEIEALNISRQSMVDNAASMHAQLLSDMEKASDEHRQRVASLETEHANAVGTLASSHTIEIDALKVSIAQLEAQLYSLSDNAESEKGTLKQQVTSLEGKATSLQKELDAKRKEGERAESVCNSLKNQIETLREELKATQKAYRDKMDASLSKVDAEWQCKVDSLVLTHEASLAAAIREVHECNSISIDDMTKQHTAEIHVLKTALSNEANASSAQLATLELERISLEAALSAEKEAHAAHAMDLTLTHAAAMKALEDKRTTDIEALRKELMSGSDARECLLIKAHADEVTMLKALIAHTQSEIKTAIDDTTSKCNSDAEHRLKSELLLLENKLRQLHDDAVIEMKRVHSQSMYEATNSHAAAIGTISNELQDKQRNVDMLCKEVSDVSHLLNQERSIRQQREESFVLEKDQLQRVHDTDIRKEREATERKLMEATERSLTEMKIMKGEHADDRHRYDDRIKDMQHEYVLLEQRYKSRESRSDDLARISSLEQEMLAKDELIQKMKDEVVYYKRELVNREENYNQKFAAKPNVGVMQVLKPKDDNTKGSGKASNKPTYAVGAGNMGMGMGMGMGGMGIGSSASSKR